MYQAKVDRYSKNTYVPCGNSGLKLSKLSFGLWHGFGDACQFDTMRELCLTAFDCGITSFDLANIYGPARGAAELNFGRILEEDLKPHRLECIITTKAGYPMWDGPVGSGGSRKHIITSLDESLSRLGLDYVDIYYHHLMDPETPLEETMEALAQTVRQGKALYVGLSNYDGKTAAEAAKILKEIHCPFIVNQNRYSILDRTIEDNGLKQTCKDLHVGLITFSPLAQGLLTGKYLNGIPEDSRMNTDGRFLKSSVLTPEKITMLQKLNALAQQRGEPMAQMALNWVLQHEEVTSVIIGASRAEQIKENLKVLGCAPISQEELSVIDELSASVKGQSIFA